MTRQTKIILTVSVAAFLISLTGVLWGFFLPVGAITFGLFLISNLLGREMALYDEEQRLRKRQIEALTSAVRVVHAPAGPVLSAAPAR
jgi:hypothetical protein